MFWFIRAAYVTARAVLHTQQETQSHHSDCDTAQNIMKHSHPCTCTTRTGGKTKKEIQQLDVMQELVQLSFVICQIVKGTMWRRAKHLRCADG